MPVVLGENLTLEENKLSAVYKELYTKLNKAYAWTNTQTTSSGGTAVVLYNGDNLTSIECENINSLGQTKPTNVDNNFYNNYIIINNILYYYHEGQLYNSNENNVKKVFNGFSQQGYGTGCFFIKNDNTIYHCEFNSSNNFIIQQIETNINWNDIGEMNYAYGNKVCAIGNSHLYTINTTVYYTLNETLINNSETWDKISTCYGISNGFLYNIYNNTLDICDNNNNNWIDIKSLDNTNSTMSLNSIGEIYKWEGTNKITKLNINNVKTFYPISGNIGACGITNDNKLFYTVISNNIINNDMIWSDISYPSRDNKFYAIGDGKLYKIEISNNNFIFTQIGSNTNYVKLQGIYDGLCIAWTGEATSFSHTVYTTKKPIKNDKTYSNANNEIYSTISSVDNSLNTITDEYRTYERDISKDSHFTEIPPASVHEKVSVIDILNATNPND